MKTPHQDPVALYQENQRLQRSVRELSLLNDLATTIGVLEDLDTILQTIAHRTIRAVDAAQGVITLVDEKTPKDHPSDALHTLVRSHGSGTHHDALRPGMELVGWMHLNKAPLLITDPQHDPRFTTAAWPPAVKAVLSVPLLTHRRLAGILTVYKTQGAFTLSDQRLLSIIAGQSAQVIERARLYTEEQELHRIQAAMQVAGEIQRRLLPATPPTLAGYDFAGHSTPAQQVGGDFYDFIPLPEDRLALCIGDVSGKGLPACLVMANVQATVRSQAHTSGSVQGCLEQSNRLLCHSTRRSTFVTLFYGILDARSHRLRYANAGHDRPLRFAADGTTETLSEGHLVLGIRPEHAYPSSEQAIAPGDVLVFYSDGVTEAFNNAREQFGLDRLRATVRACLRRNPGASAQAVLAAVHAAVTLHRGSAPQADDLTMVVLCRRP